jgi:ribose transport system substrate-binding protein
VPQVVLDRVAKAKNLPEFEAAGPPIDAKKTAGKKMFVIPQVANPFHESVVDAMKEAATSVGMEVTLYPTQGQPSQWIQGMDSAVAAGVDLINLVGIDPRLLQPQLDAAKRAGIPVVSTHIYDNSAKQAPECDGCHSLTALVPGPFYEAGEVAADWIIADSKGRANLLVVGAPDVPVSAGTVSLIEKRFSEQCTNCTISVINVPAADWNTKVQREIQTALTRDPSISYVYPLYDAMVAGAVPAVRAAGMTGKVKVGSYNGSPFALKFIQDGDIVAMNVGEDSVGIGYASMDQSFRILLGEPLVEARTPIRLWDTTNVVESGTPPVTAKGYGDALKRGYEKLWGLG